MGHHWRSMHAWHCLKSCRTFHRKRRPSRLLYFLLGAGTTTWVVNKQEELEAHARALQLCKRPGLDMPKSWYQSGWPESMADVPRAINSIPIPEMVLPFSNDSEMTVNIYPPTPMPSHCLLRNSKCASNMRAHIDKKSRAATDALLEMTESTLNAILVRAEFLKEVAKERVRRSSDASVVQNQPSSKETPASLRS